MQRALAQLQPCDRAIQAVWSGVPAQSNLSYPQLDRIARRATAADPRPGAVRRPRLPPGDVGRSVRQPRRGRRPRQLARPPQRPAPAHVHARRLRADPDRRRARGAEAPVPARRRPRDVQGRGAAPVVLRRRRGEAAADPARRRRPAVRARAAARRAARRAHVRLDRSRSRPVRSTTGSSRVSTPRLDRAQSTTRAALGHLHRRRTDRHDPAIRATSRVAGERLLILGGDAAVLLLGFALLASSRLRRDHRDVRQRLLWSGARRSQILLVAATEVVGITVVAEHRGLGCRHRCGRGARSPSRLPRAAWSSRTRSSRCTSLWIALALAAVDRRWRCWPRSASTPSPSEGSASPSPTPPRSARSRRSCLRSPRGKADARRSRLTAAPACCCSSCRPRLFVLAVTAARLLAPPCACSSGARAVRAARPRRAPLARALAGRRAAHRRLLRRQRRHRRLRDRLSRDARAGRARAGALRGARAVCPSGGSARLVSVQEAPPPQTVPDPGRARLGNVSGTAAATSRSSRCRPAALAAIDGWRSDFSARTPAQLAALLRPRRRRGCSGSRSPDRTSRCRSRRPAIASASLRSSRTAAATSRG